MPTSPEERELGSPSDSASRRRIGWLGIGLIVLGVCRAWSNSVSLVNDLRHQDGTWFVVPSASPWSDYGGVVWGAWPIVLGIVVAVRRSTLWMKAAAVTALALGIERTASLAIGAAFDSGWSVLYRGGYDGLQERLFPRGGSLALRVATTVAWFVLGVAALRLRGQAMAEKGHRHRVCLLNGAAVLFACALLGVAGWTTYENSLVRLPWVRAMVLNGDRPRLRRPQFEGAMGRQLYDAEGFVFEGRRLAADGKLAEARRALIKGVNRLEATMDDYPKERGIRREFALAANNLAWFLVTCEDLDLRDAEVALAVARKAVEANPDDGNTLNTLAVAHFRAGELDDASKVFAESMALRQGGDSFDWYFLAQIEAMHKHPAEAKAWYDKAVAWEAEHRPLDAELFRFRTEAAATLGLPKPELPPQSKSRTSRPSPTLLGPNGFRRR